MNQLGYATSLSIVNAFSVDVEDYFHVEALAAAIHPSRWSELDCRVERNTRRCLELLAERSVKATFFVLGWVAQRYPGLVREIHASGHEVACHGMSHQMVNRQTQAVFREEAGLAKTILEDATGAAVRGYRAATYSITKSSLWALDVLEDLGYCYDSSIFPVHHDLYGIPDAPRFAFRPGNGLLLEVPITTVNVFGQRFPCGGGGYFRLLPYTLFRAGIRRVNNKDRQSAVFYCHPWEIDPEQPRVPGLSLKSRFRHYTNIGRMEARIRRLLGEFRWGRMDEVFGIV
jgi:polysaccharide deacetylase family protein (PEP-CTERM system associated)